MNAARRIAILAAIIGLLAIVFMLFSRLPGPRWAQGANRAVDAFERADRSFRSDPLGARIGLLDNYDPLNRASWDQRLAVQTLQAYAASDAIVRQEVAALARMVDQRDTDAERFKSSNALIHNSLARFATLSETSPQSASLSAHMLRLTLDTSPTVIGEAKASIADLTRLPRTRRSPVSWQMIMHAKLLVRALPYTDALLEQIQAVPIDRQLARIRALATAQQMIEDAADRRIKIGIAVTIFAFLAFMISTRLRLIMRARALRRKVEVEHIGGTVSALLIDAQSHDLPDRIERGLAALGAYMEVDCAFLVLYDDRQRVFCWSRDGRLPEAAPSILVDRAARERWEGDRLRVMPDHSNISESFSLQMDGVGLRSLKLLRAAGTEPCPATLGCGSANPDLKDGSDVLLVCQMTLAAILQAVRRDLLENEHSQLERELQQARRMETIGAMATGVAHNFNNIMGAIGGFAEIAELHVPQFSPAADNLDEICRAVDRGRDLVDQILTFGRCPSEQRALIDVPNLLAETSRMLRALNPEVDVALSIHDEAGEVFGFTSQVQQVIMNIARNAAHAMDQAGEIRIMAGRRNLAKPTRFSHGRLAAGRFALIEISDIGPGIDPAVLPKIFNPFFTTRQGGTGLGLSTAWEVIQGHGGTIDVRSDSAGSCFALWLPLAVGNMPGGIRHICASGGHGDRVLLIGREAHLLDRDEELLAVLGYEPVGIVAQTAPVELPPFDMIDAVLLIDTGIETGLARRVLAQVCAAAAGLPILLATNNPTRRHLRIPGVTQLHYPFRMQELATALSMTTCAFPHGSHADGRSAESISR